MLSLFASLKNVFKVRPIRIESHIFRLHYRLTTVLLLCACVMVTARQYFGDPIVCIPPNQDEVPKDALETFCWIHSTFTLVHAHELQVGVDTIYPGVGNSRPKDKKIYYQYYQWVCFVLFFQAVLFYLPHYIWKGMENGTIRKILLELNYPVQNFKKRNDSRVMLADYLQSTARTHNLYAYKYLFCEILNFFNVVSQIYLVDEFLGNEFSTYGTRVLQFSSGGDSERRVDPLTFVFPRVTKCSFRKYGPSGDIQLHDSLCILPLNIVNEKIYIFMWFWFVLLALATEYSLGCLFVAVFGLGVDELFGEEDDDLLLSQAAESLENEPGDSSGLQIIVSLPILFLRPLRALVLRLENRFADAENISHVVGRVGLGDWLVLRFLADNMDPMNFKEVMHMLVEGTPTIIVDGNCTSGGSGDHGRNNNGQKLLQTEEI